MDDGRIATEMSMDEIARQLGAIRSDITSIKNDMTAVTTDLAVMKTDMTDVKADITDLKADMTDLKTDMTVMKTDLTNVQATVSGLSTGLMDLKSEMESGFNDSKMRDEELRDLMKFGLEAREALRETVEAGFDETGRNHDDQISLLKDVLKDVRR
jgi:chromosome segregation ATPase